MKGTPPLKKRLNLSYKPLRVLHFTDCHDRVDLPQDRFEWLGKLIADEEPDAIVCGGDAGDFDSVNTHAKNETYEGKLKPGYAKELSSLNNAFKLIDAYHTLKVPKYITFGNHEHRVYRYENNNPEVWGIMSSAMEDVFESNGWKITPFKQYLNLDGVEFTHAPVNAMGKEIGGKGATLRIATDSLYDIVYGHSHARADVVAAKLGPENRRTRAYNAGCYMPANYRMSYANASQSHWDYGVSIIEIWGGRIHAIQWISIEEIQCAYS